MLCRPKIDSVKIAPPSAMPMSMPSIVTTGSSAFRSTCFTITVLLGAPVVRPVPTESSLSVSAEDDRSRHGRVLEDRVRHIDAVRERAAERAIDDEALEEQAVLVRHRLVEAEEVARALDLVRGRALPDREARGIGRDDEED